MQNQSPLPPKPKVEEADYVSMTFFEALNQMLQGKRVTRISWGSSSEYGYIGTNDCLWIFTRGEIHTWEIHRKDIEANDWIVVKEEVKSKN